MVQLGLHPEYPRARPHRGRATARRCSPATSSHQRSMLRTRWTPSPCARLSRPRTTTGPPPHPDGISRRRAFPPTSWLLAGEGTAGMVPTFTLEPFDGVGAQLCPCSIATATPQTFTVASRPATSHRPRSSPHAKRAGARCYPAHDPPGSSWWHLLRGVQPLVPHVRLSVSLAGPGPSGGAGPSRRCQGCFPPSPPSQGSGCPQLHRPAATSPEAVSFHHRTVQERLVALDDPSPTAGPARFGSNWRSTRSSLGRCRRGGCSPVVGGGRCQLRRLGASAARPACGAASAPPEAELGVDPGRAIGAAGHAVDVDDGVGQLCVVPVAVAARLGPPRVEPGGRHLHHPTTRRDRAGPGRLGR